MLVPTIAFAFWVASLPTAQPAISLDGLLAETAHLDATGERVKLKLVTPELVTAAEAYLDLPMGAERFLTMHGKRYVFVLEQHYHPPGFVGAPTGFHKGVTVYEVHSAPSALGSPRSARRQ
jgi:hypothetical protein